MANHPSILAWRIPQTVCKGKKIRHRDELCRSEGLQYATKKEQRAISNSSSKNEATGPKQKQCSVVDVLHLMVKVKSDPVKNNVA